jgi:hypothetical protein
MNEILANLNSGSWWFTAVAAAIVVNLISSYLRDGTDRVWRFTMRRLNHHKAAVETQGKRIVESNRSFLEQLRLDEELRRFLVEAEVRARLMSLQLIVLGCGCALLGYALLSFTPNSSTVMGRATYLFSLPLLYVGAQQFTFAHSLSTVLLKVERLRRPEV